MPLSVLKDLREHKIPAILGDKAIKPAGREPRILLFARAGFDAALRRAAAADERLELIDAPQLVTELLAGQRAA